MFLALNNPPTISKSQESSTKTSEIKVYQYMPHIDRSSGFQFPLVGRLRLGIILGFAFGGSFLFSAFVVLFGAGHGWHWGFGDRKGEVVCGGERRVMDDRGEEGTGCGWGMPRRLILI